MPTKKEALLDQVEQNEATADESPSAEADSG